MVFQKKSITHNSDDERNVRVGCIFDMDGTLLDSMGVWTQVDIDFFAKRGIAMPSDYGAKVVSMPFERIAKYTIERFSLPESPQEIMDEWNEMVRYAYTHTVQVKPHAVEYLRRLKSAGIPLVVATSLPPQLRDPALEHAGIADCFDTLCSTDDVENGKESADIYLLAAHKLGCEPSDCVVFEDILSGIRSAKRAGMRAWGMYDDSSAQNWEQIKHIADGAINDFSQAPKLWDLEELS